MIIDIILIIVISATVYYGYKKGFVKMLTNFLGTFVSAILAYFFYIPFKEIIVKFTGLDELVFEKVVLKLKEFGAHASKTSVSGSDIDAVSKMQMPDSIKDKLTNYLTESTSGMTKSAALSIADFIVTIISVFILFIAILILIKIIDKTLNLVTKVPVLSTINRVGGVIFSLLSCYLILTISFMLFSSFASIDMLATSSRFIENSILAKALIEYNPLFIMLANISF